MWIFLIAMGVTAWNVETRKEMHEPKIAHESSVDENGCRWRVGSDGVTRYTCPGDPEEWAQR